MSTESLEGNCTEKIIGDTEKCDLQLRKISIFKVPQRKLKSVTSFHENHSNDQLQYPSEEQEDVEFVRVNQDFYDMTESVMELQPALNETVNSTIDLKEETTLMERMSKIFQPTGPTWNSTDKEFNSPGNIRNNDELYDQTIDAMCSAIYAENVVTKEDFLNYMGYTIRTEGADLCINSVIFNIKENMLRIVIKISEYDQFYRGSVNRIRSQPKIMIEEDKWTMYYATFDDDELGIVEIEVPEGVSVDDIRCQGPVGGFITVDIPQSPKS